MSGFNVFPAEVEEVIGEMPGVADVAVVGVAHPHTGEAVKAYVVCEPGVRLDEEAVISHCRDQMARYKCPTKVLFVDELPPEPVRQGPSPSAPVSAVPTGGGAKAGRGDQEAAEEDHDAGHERHRERRVLAEPSGERAAGRQDERARRDDDVAERQPSRWRGVAARSGTGTAVPPEPPGRPQRAADHDEGGHARADRGQDAGERSEQLSALGQLVDGQGGRAWSS